LRAPSKRELSTLAEQNKLLQQALDARRRGDETHAIESLDTLLTRYPSSPLTQEARVEKFRALEARSNHSRAVVEAQRYLADYPAGFAVNEAKALISR
jgi:outer membrane protein assembly factor BamD (BamD/ComL family)